MRFLLLSSSASSRDQCDMHRISTRLAHPCLCSICCFHAHHRHHPMLIPTNNCLFAAISYFMRYPHQPHGTPPTGPVMPIMYPHLSCLGHLPSQLTPILPTLHNPPLPPPQCKSPIMSSSASKLSSHAVSMASPLLPCLLFTRFWFSIYSLLSVIR